MLNTIRNLFGKKQTASVRMYWIIAQDNHGVIYSCRNAGESASAASQHLMAYWARLGVQGVVLTIREA